MNLIVNKAALKWAPITLAVILVAGCTGNGNSTSVNQNKTNTATSSTSTPAEVSNSNVYKNMQYGFSFKLPATWKGYSIVNSQWEGIANVAQSGSAVVETGQIISIRDPEWTTKTPRQDIPIMVLTLNQWNSLKQGVFHIGAAPMDPSELGRNNYYVFALPARYNYAFLPGFKDVENILAGNPLQTMETTNYQPDSSEILLSKMMELAKQGKVINCGFTAKTSTISDVEKVWGRADKTDYVATAKGSYSTYSKHNAVFGFNKGEQIFEIRSSDSQLMGITLATAKEVLGAPVYDAKSGGQEIIGYIANSSYKLELVFPQPTNDNPNPVIDHYNVLFPAATVNSMADDPGRQW